MSVTRCLRILWWLAGLALLLSLVREPVLRQLRSSSVLHERLPAAWMDGGFIANGAYPSTAASMLPAGVRAAGSWQPPEGDGWQGAAATPWWSAQGNFRVYVAGYPRHAGCALFVELRKTGQADVTRLDCPLPDPAETWQPWNLDLPADTASWRIRAEDRAADRAGWLAFSEPVGRSSEVMANGFMLLQVFATVALALVVLWGPGLLLAPRFSSAGLRTIAVLGAGPLALAVIALLIWLGDGMVRPHYLGFAATLAGWLVIGWRWRREPPTLSAGEAAIIAVASLVVTATAAKAAYAGGPEGELYAGMISRTLEVGDRSDARISFHVVQTAGRHFAPWSAEAEQYFRPWTFFSRGPLAGLVATPLSLATSGRPPAEMPDQPWQIFDPSGFAAYRIALMVLASMIVFALFAALRVFVGERWAVIGAGLLALSPFGVHEIMFTWPKWEATAWVVASFLLVHERRPFVAGLALGIGFLYHPLAALWTPWLGLWAVGPSYRADGSFVVTGARFGGSFLCIMAAWMLLGHAAPHTADATSAGQAGFLDYFRMADGGPADAHSWWHSRGLNFANTFLPFWLHAFHRDHPSLSSVYASSGALVRFAFGWWCTLPLGLGLGLWAIVMVALARAARALPIAFGLLVAGPALFLIAYWGAAATGLMRECAHPLYVAILALACVILASGRGWSARLLAHPIMPWLQLPATVVMLWLTTLLSPQRWAQAEPVTDVTVFVVNLLALAAAAAVLSRARRDATLAPAIARNSASAPT